MPSSPKFFHARSYSSSIRIRSTALNVCFLIGSLVFFIGLVAIARRSLGYRCINVRPNTVSIAWETVRNGNADDDHHVYRRRAMGFVGVFTGFGSAERRRSLRLTWMPSQRHDLHSLEEATGLVFKFIIGRTSDKAKMSVIMKEVAEFDDFIILDIKEEDSKLPYKTLAFFKAAYALYDCDFYVKSDDGIYLRPDRLSLLLAKERAQTRTYLGCMKKGLVFSDPKLKWHEPLSTLLGKEYFMHAYGPLYALSADVVASMVALRNNSFRMFKNEDVTIGAWMLAMNVNYEDNRQLCQAECTSTSIAVWDIPKCSGLCNPETKLLELHKSESCSGTSTLDSD